MPSFSVIVPVYNTSRYLSKCVDSILDQTCGDFELILVDDGSTDGSAGICDAYADRDIRTKVIHKKNGGVSSARNTGIDVATGTFLWFVDSDDYIEPFSLEQLLAATKEHAADLYIFNNASLREFVAVDLEEFLRRYYFTYAAGFGPWNKLYRRSIVERRRLRFDCEETIGEDLLFNVGYYNALFESGGGRSFFGSAETTINT